MLPRGRSAGHELIGTERERGVGAPLPIAELHLKGLAAAQDVDDRAYLSPSQVDCGEIDGQRHHFEKLSCVFHLADSASYQDVTAGQPWSI